MFDPLLLNVLMLKYFVLLFGRNGQERAAGLP